MCETKFVDLLIFNNLLVGRILISPTVFEIQGFEKSQKTPLTPNVGEIFPRLCCQTRSLDSQLEKYFERILTQVRTFLEPLAPDKLFEKQFFRNISKPVRDIKKIYGLIL